MRRTWDDCNFVAEDVLDSVKISEGKCEGEILQGRKDEVVEIQEPVENCRELFVIPTKSSAMLIG